MNLRTRHARPGFSLIEALVAVMVLAIVAAVIAPVVSSASEVYIATATTRRATERAGFAVERLVRFIRQVPPGATAGTVSISAATSSSVVLENGSGFALAGQQIVLTDATGATGVLCDDVEQFEVQLLAEDGVTSTIGTPGLTRRVNITLRAANMTIVSSAFIRAGASL
ncbi:MAG: hypothetical protein GIKADHBN_01554 [Phycisphaerales bacterium]|nr:hypothetical protein [Phycisphaerales bacterium]